MSSLFASASATRHRTTMLANNNQRNSGRRNEKGRFRRLVGKTTTTSIQPLFLGQQQQRPSKDQEKKKSDEQDDEESTHKYKKAKEQLHQSQKQLLELSSIIHSLGTISIDYEKEQAQTTTTKNKKSPSWTRIHRNDTAAPRMTPQEVSATNLKRKIQTLHQEYERLQQENQAKDAMIRNLLHQQQYHPANKRQKITSNTRRLEPLGMSSSTMLTTSSTTRTETETDMSSTSRMTMTSSSTSCLSNVSSHSSKDEQEEEDLSPLQEVLSLGGGRTIDEDHHDLRIGGVPIRVVEVKQEHHQQKQRPQFQLYVKGKTSTSSSINDKREQQDVATSEAEIRKNYEIALQIIETQQYQIQMLMAQQNRRTASKVATDKVDIDLIDAMHTKNIQNAREETKRKIRQLQNRD